MSHILPSTFSRYHLDSQEQVQAETLTSLNLQAMQNLICDCAEAKVNLKFDPSNPQEFLQKEAELQGQIGILRLLVEQSAIASRVHVIDSE